jgi:hypothetical protein
MFWIRFGYLCKSHILIYLLNSLILDILFYAMLFYGFYDNKYVSFEV